MRHFYARSVLRWDLRKLKWAVLFILIVCLPLEFLPVLGLLTWWCASTLGAALLWSSRVGSDLGLVYNEILYQINTVLCLNKVNRYCSSVGCVCMHAWAEMYVHGWRSWALTFRQSPIFLFLTKKPSFRHLLLKMSACYQLEVLCHLIIR